MDKPKLGRLERVNLEEVWPMEAQDFTPWLAESENLNQLAEAIGLGELALVATEHAVSAFKLDILCTDGEDKVVIENQLAQSDHTHLGQLLVYAAGVGAKKVIWIAKSFRPEHLSALRLLNETTTEDLNFFAVQIELWRIGDSPIAPKFEVIVKPDYWAKNSREQAKAASVASDIKKLQKEFWAALKEAITNRGPWISTRQPDPKHWYDFPIGRGGFLLRARVNTRDEWLGLELWISGENAKQHFKSLFDQKQNIENKLGFKLDWQELPDRDGCRIATWHLKAPIEDRSRWGEYLEWFIEKLTIMDRVLRPIVRALP